METFSEVVTQFHQSGYHIRQLNPNAGAKPLDFGRGGIIGSVNLDGRIIAVNAYHPQHGIMTLTSAPPFSEADRYDPLKVRSYRFSLIQSPGFGFVFTVPIAKREYFLIEDAIPLIHFTLENGVEAVCITRGEEKGVLQTWEFSESGEWAVLTGKLWLKRSAYTQLTEGGVIQFPNPETRIRYNQDTPLLFNEALPAAVAVTPMTLVENEDGSVVITDQRAFPSEGITSILSFQFVSQHHAPVAADEDHPAQWRSYWASASWTERFEQVEKRALAYALRCCIPIDEEAICFITDHMLLPLSWNRDAYYVALALMQWGEVGRRQVRGHLIWMFERAERVAGKYWARSYLANGKVKDEGFQLDQQIFPLLELLAYTRISGDTALYERLKGYIEPTLDMIFSYRKGDTWLIATEETPADDPIAYPFHFSSHVLLWYTLRQLAEVTGAGHLSTYAENIRDAIGAYFISEHDGTVIYAYATDGEGHYHHYHDANDIPLVMMPSWRFCRNDDPIWCNTIEFAWSEKNVGGVYDGKLGSVHTPAPWSLGDAQELILSKVIGDAERVQCILNRISDTAQWDGALPEAYHADDNRVASRHWFAWSNAMVLLALQLQGNSLSNLL